MVTGETARPGGVYRKPLCPGPMGPARKEACYLHRILCGDTAGAMGRGYAKFRELAF